MKRFLFYSAFILLISCSDSSQDISNSLIVDNIESKKETNLNNYTYEDFLDIEVSQINNNQLLKSSETPCQFEWEDIVNDVKCTVSHWRTFVPASVAGVDCDIAVEYSTSTCFLGSNLQSITVASVSVDYDYIAQNCPDVQFPSDPNELEEFLLELERNVGDFVERQAFTIITNQNDFNTDCTQTFSVAVTRVSASCFQYCWIPPSDPFTLFGPTKVYCGSDICCFKRSIYCTNQNGTLLISESLNWSTGSSCEDLDCNNPSSDCSHDCDIIF